MVRVHTLEPRKAVIKKIVSETPNVKTFTLEYVDKKKQKEFHFLPGEFMELSVFGFGEMPISIASNPKEDSNVQLTVMNTGTVSKALHSLKKGALVGLRGPFGKGFPIPRFKEKNVVLVAGGVGLPPIRSVLLELLNNRRDFKEISLFYGARDYENFCYKKELTQWKKRDDVNVFLSVDNPTDKMECRIGVVTCLFGEDTLPKDIKNSVVAMCGPGIMLKFAVIELKKFGFKDEQIFVSLERMMQCGIGKCCHCNIGDKYVCIDGPVFNVSELKKDFTEELV